MPVAIAVVGVVAFTASGWFAYRWLTTSERFAITDIEIRGNARVGTDRLRARCGVHPGDNVFRVDLAAVERAVTASPWIATAHAERQLPGRLIIRVTERRAAALVELGGLYLADARGEVFKRASIEDGEGANLPVVTGIGRADYLADPVSAHALVRRALGVVHAYAAGADRPAVGEVHIDARHDITLMTYETALAVRLGDASGAALAERLRAFDDAWGALDDRERRAAQVVFLDNHTNPDRITVRIGGRN